MQKIRVLTVSLALCFFTPLIAQQSKRGPSTAEEKLRALAAIDDLESHPLGPNAKEERRWLTIWLIEVPDIHVGICNSLLPDRPKDSKQDGDLVSIQVMFSSARYAIQHNGGDSNSLDQYMEGVHGALRTYEVLVAEKPKDRQPKLDEMLQQRQDGTLADVVKKRVESECKK